MKHFYHRLFVLALVAVLFAAETSAQKNILLVGRDALGDYQSDQDMNDSLTAWGYTPEYWGSAEFQVGVGLDYANYDAIVINEPVDSKMMARFGTTDGYPIPCVNMEGYVVAPTSDRWAWLEDLSTELFQTDGGAGAGTADDLVLLIKDNSHYITEIFEVGDEIVWSEGASETDIQANGPVSIKEVSQAYSAKLGQMKSHQSMADFWNLVTVDDIAGTGNRLVYWGVNHIPLNGEDQMGSFGTPEFYTIVKRSVEWVLGEDGGGTGIEKAELNAFDLVAFPNPASERVTVRYNAPEAGSSTATLFNMTGQVVDVIQKTAVFGKNFLYLEANNYPAGMYQLQVDLGGKFAVTKVVIQ